MSKKMVFSVALALSFCFVSYSIAQTQNVEKVQLGVSPMQQKNIDALMSSISKHETLKLNSGFTGTLNSVFSAMKSNDYNKYRELRKQLTSEYNKLTQKEKDSYSQFMKSAPYPNPTDSDIYILRPPTQSCSVQCTYGSCSITCGGPYRPWCTCEMGVPTCECVN